MPGVVTEDPTAERVAPLVDVTAVLTELAGPQGRDAAEELEALGRGGRADLQGGGPVDGRGHLGGRAEGR